MPPRDIYSDVTLVPYLSDRSSLTETAYSIQHTAYNRTPGRLSLQREWGWMETMETALAHIST